MSKIGGGLLVIAIIAVIALLFGRYQTVEPCGMLKAEIEIRAKNLDLASLGSVPNLMMNDGDQVWCSKELVRTVTQ